MTVGQKRKRPAPDYAMTVIDRSASQLCNTGTTTTYSSPATSLSSSPSPAPESPRDRLVAASTDTAPQDAGDGVDMAVQLERVASSSRTPFEKRVLSLLCQIPRGRVSTYGLLSAHLGSSPRAIGGALRRNPFAPQVPCHRVVAAGGGLGGFKGRWPVDGEGITMDEKRHLLRGEGIRFDGKGRVLGTPWSGFK